MIPIYLNGKIVGKMNYIGQYVTVRRPEHFFVKFQGFGISEAVIEKIIRIGKQLGFSKDQIQVKIIYLGKKGKQVFVTRLTKFLSEGSRYEYQDGDFQYILPVKKMYEVVA